MSTLDTAGYNRSKSTQTSSLVSFTELLLRKQSSLGRICLKLIETLKWIRLNKNYRFLALAHLISWKWHELQQICWKTGIFLWNAMEKSVSNQTWCKKKWLLFWVLGPFDFLSGISLESKVKDKVNLIISLITWAWISPEETFISGWQLWFWLRTSSYLPVCSFS